MAVVPPCRTFDIGGALRRAGYDERPKDSGGPLGRVRSRDVSIPTSRHGPMRPKYEHTTRRAADEARTNGSRGGGTAAGSSSVSIAGTPRVVAKPRSGDAGLAAAAVGVSHLAGKPTADAAARTPRGMAHRAHWRLRLYGPPGTRGVSDSLDDVAAVGAAPNKASTSSTSAAKRNGVASNASPRQLATTGSVGTPHPPNTQAGGGGGGSSTPRGSRHPPRHRVDVVPSSSSSTPRHNHHRHEEDEPAATNAADVVAATSGRRPRSAPSIRPARELAAESTEITREDPTTCGLHGVVGHAAVVPGSRSPSPPTAAAARSPRPAPQASTAADAGGDDLSGGVCVEGHARSTRVPLAVGDSIGRPPAFAEAIPPFAPSPYFRRDGSKHAAGNDSVPHQVAPASTPRRPHSARVGPRGASQLHYVTPDPTRLHAGLSPAADLADAEAKLRIVAAHNPLRLPTRALPTVYAYLMS